MYWIVINVYVIFFVLKGWFLLDKWLFKYVFYYGFICSLL